MAGLVPAIFICRRCAMATFDRMMIFKNRSREECEKGTSLRQGIGGRVRRRKAVAAKPGCEQNIGQMHV
jgi:hypothetical protein